MKIPRPLYCGALSVNHTALFVVSKHEASLPLLSWSKWLEIAGLKLGASPRVAAKSRPLNCDFKTIIS